MHRISRFFFIVMQLLLLIDNSLQSKLRQTNVAFKVIGNTIKHPFTKKISNTIKNPKGILNFKQKFTSSITKGVEKQFNTRNNLGSSSVNYLGKEGIRNFKHKVPYGLNKSNRLAGTKGNKNIQMRSFEQIGGKELKPFVDMFSIKNMVSLLVTGHLGNQQLSATANAGNFFDAGKASIDLTEYKRTIESSSKDKSLFQNSDKASGGSNYMDDNLESKPDATHGTFEQVAGYDNVYILAKNEHKLLMSTLTGDNTLRKDYVETLDKVTEILLEGTLGHEEMVTEKRLSPTGAEYDHYTRAHPKLCYVSMMRSAQANNDRIFSLFKGNVAFIKNMLGQFTWQNAFKIRKLMGPKLKKSGKIQTKKDLEAGLIQLCDRNEETGKTDYFYDEFPEDVSERIVCLVDPVLVTGGSTVTCIDQLIKEGVPQENIRFVNMVSSPKGISNLVKAYPKVKFYTGAIDEKQNR